VEAWGGTATLERDGLPPGTTYVTIGRGKRFCFAPCGNRRAFWFASVNDRVGARELAAHFADFHDPIPRLIASTAEAETFRTRIRYRPPLEVWGRGRVTLLGDAIHPITPDLAQGACQAIESAQALAAALQRSEDHPAALRAYERTRRRRMERITYLSWIATTQSMRSDALFCLARDAVTDVLLRTVARRELAWLMRGGDS
jgi:2-polyprenyl-6-methoxyphenol hydroxylase-like FAD-dependent oxidoreductase